MKRTKLLRNLVVVLLSVLLVANLSTYVFADDEDFWDTPTASNNAVANTTTDTNLTTGTNSSDFIEPEIVTSSAENNTANTNSNSNSESFSTQLETDNDTNTNENKANTLAYTGAEDTSVLAIVMVLGLIVAAYSFKKLREYNNL